MKPGKKLRKAFLWKAEGMKNEDIIKRLDARGVSMYKQQLTNVFKKPFYCGIINPLCLTENYSGEISNLQELIKSTVELSSNSLL